MISSRRWNEPNLAQTRVKRQHYVPKCYLKPFVGADGKIRVFGHDGSDAPYRTNLDNVAVEARYYDVKANDISLSTETWLSQLEGDAVPVIGQLLEAPASIASLSGEQETHLARFVAALMFRGPSFRQLNADIRASTVAQIKRLARQFLENRYKPEEADRLWKEWEHRPDEWWLHETTSVSPAERTSYMLGEVQGFANLLLAMPWRAGCVPSTMRLYTSDNPVARFISPARFQRYGGMFTMFSYFLPLSPRVLLKVGPIELHKEDVPPQPRGERHWRDFSGWETGFALCALTRDSIRFLFGEAQMISRDNANEHLTRVEQSIVWFNAWLGIEPGPLKWPV